MCSGTTSKPYILGYVLNLQFFHSNSDSAKMTDFKHYSPPCSTKNPIQHKGRYHVFLSFRGPDVRKTLVDHLFLSLSTAGLHVFLDTERLEKGENIGVNLEEAIKGSTIYLPIFSPGYCTSAWCLKELSLMWASKSACTDTTIIPLFYKVEPSDVRYPDKDGPEKKSPYAEALKMHNEKGRHTPEEIAAWKEALYQVSLLSGWSLEYTAAGYEGRLVKGIVMDLVRVLNINYLSIAKYPVGLKDQREEVINLLKIDGHGVRTIGIWGMGGVGKTTLSKAIYNEIHHLFEASYFVPDIRATARESVKGLKNLQRQVLSDFLKVDIKINSVDQGKIKMKNHLTSVRALVILDDVDDEEQFDALVGDWYGQGSRIIITTRERQVLERVKVDKIHPMKGLDRHQSVELFSWHAFMRVCPEKGYEDMAERIVDACDGLPLSLEIVGAHLYNKSDLRYWSEAIENIPNVGDEKVYKTLKVSYDALTIQEKQIFLDIACFFVMPKKNVDWAYSLEFYLRLWNVLGCNSVFTSLTNLEGKSLIVKNRDFGDEDLSNKKFCHFRMHDHIRDLGRRIVKEESWNNPGERSRLWHEKDIVRVMATKEKMPSVRGLMWKELKSTGQSFVGEEFKRVHFLASMQNLEFLFCLSLRLKSPVNVLPPNLKYLVLSGCELEEHKLFSQVHHTEIDKSFEAFSLKRLKFLVSLDMSNTALFCLPNEIGELLCLEELYLKNCRLKELPQSFGNLVNLKILDGRENQLEELPALPKALINVDFWGCHLIQKISSMFHMQSLRKLDLDWFTQLEEMPALPQGLLYLNAAYCPKLQKMPSMSHLCDLKVLDLRSCSSLTKLPNLESLQSLRKLHLNNCCELEEMPALPQGLLYFNAARCFKLQKMPSMSHMCYLETLHLPECTSLSQLPNLESMQSLKEFTLDMCKELKDLPRLPKGLTYLSISRCYKLQKIFTMSAMKMLKIIILSCTNLIELPRLDLLHSLRELHIIRCKKLVELPCLPEGLVIFEVTHCVSLQKLPSMSHMIKLEFLDLSWCKSLARLPQLNCLISLRKLILDYCDKLEYLPPLPEGCTNLSRKRWYFQSKTQSAQNVSSCNSQIHCLGERTRSEESTAESAPDYSETTSKRQRVN